MTTITISIERDNSWECEGSPLQSMIAIWNTDGSQHTQETIAKEISTFLRTMSRTPIRAVSFAEVFLDGPPSREEREDIRAEKAAASSKEFLDRMKMLDLLTRYEDAGAIPIEAINASFFSETPDTTAGDFNN